MAEISIDIIGDLKGINKSLDDLKKTAEEKGSAVGAGFTAGLTAALTTVGIQAIVKASKALGDAFSKSIEEAANADKALRLFNSSLATAGNFSEEASKKFQDFANNIQNITGVSDDLIISNASILASLGKLSGEGLERATKAAVDFAATGRISLESAFDLIAKAANGNTAALSRYGIKLDESIPQSERFAAALNQIENRFGGLAQAQVNTFSGSLERLSVNFNDIFENIGKIITNSPVLVSVINSISTTFAKFANSLESLRGQDIVGSLIKDLLTFGQTITTYVIAPLELFFNLTKVGFTGLKTILQGVLVVISELPLMFTEIIGKTITFTGKIGDLVGFFNEDLGNKIKTGLTNAGTNLSEFSSNVRTTLEDTLTQFGTQTGEQLSNAFDFSTSTGISNFISQLQTAADTATPLAEGIKNNIGGAFQSVSETASAAADKINKTFQQGVLNVISVGAQAIGASLIKGGKAFDNFKNQVLGIIGDMAIQIGTTLIGIGIGIDAIKLSLGTLSGGFAIAAGLALVAIGGLLKSLSAGSAAEGGTGVGGGVGTGFGGPAVGGGAFGTQTEFTPGQVGTNVNVVVQGNVLDRRESGLEIANIIQEHFNNNGNVLVGSTV